MCTRQIEIVRPCDAVVATGYSLASWRQFAIKKKMVSARNVNKMNSSTIKNWIDVSSSLSILVQWEQKSTQSFSFLGDLISTKAKTKNTKLHRQKKRDKSDSNRDDEDDYNLSLCTRASCDFCCLRFYFTSKCVRFSQLNRKQNELENVKWRWTHKHTIYFSICSNWIAHYYLVQICVSTVDWLCAWAFMCARVNRK